MLATPHAEPPRALDDPAKLARAARIVRTALDRLDRKPDEDAAA